METFGQYKFIAIVIIGSFLLSGTVFADRVQIDGNKITIEGNAKQPQLARKNVQYDDVYAKPQKSYAQVLKEIQGPTDLEVIQQQNDDIKSQLRDLQAGIERQEYDENRRHKY